MNWSQGGDFTKSLLSLQLQLQTLLEGVGGDSTASLLDHLARLSDTERAAVIPLITKVIAKVVAGDKRLVSAEDKELKDFEDSLFESVLAALGNSTASAEPLREAGPKLAVVSGGRLSGERLAFKKPIRIPALIDLSKERESRRSGRSAALSTTSKDLK
jgi:hypothetical protein